MTNGSFCSHIETSRHIVHTVRQQSNKFTKIWTKKEKMYGSAKYFDKIMYRQVRANDSLIVRRYALVRNLVFALLDSTPFHAYTFTYVLKFVLFKCISTHVLTYVSLGTSQEIYTWSLCLGIGIHKVTHTHNITF